MTVVYGITHYQHCGEGEMILLHYLGQILELTAVNALVLPSEMIASGYGRLRRIFHEQFALHIIHDGGTQEDAHRALTTGQQV